MVLQTLSFYFLGANSLLTSTTSLYQNSNPYKSTSSTKKPPNISGGQWYSRATLVSMFFKLSELREKKPQSMCKLNNLLNPNLPKRL